KYINNKISIKGTNIKTITKNNKTKKIENSKQIVKVARNIGTVATEVAKKIYKDEKMILELSSFQLLGVPTFKPKVAVLLNIYEAHLDFHKTIENYKQAKLNIFANQTKHDYLIYNAENKILKKEVQHAHS